MFYLMMLSTHYIYGYMAWENNRQNLLLFYLSNLLYIFLNHQNNTSLVYLVQTTHIGSLVGLGTV